MVERIKLNEFLKELVKSLNNRLDSLESSINLLKSDIKRLEANQRKDSTEEIMSKVKNLESALSTIRDLDMVDKSILKMLENEENVRRT